MSARTGKHRLRLWLRLLRVTRPVEAELRERLRRRFDTTLPRFDVLAALHRSRQGLRMGELSRALMVSNGNVTGIVDRLVADGLVQRSPLDGDRRASLVALTEQGRNAFAEMAVEHETWVDEILGELDVDEVAAMLEPLERLAPVRR